MLRYPFLDGGIAQSILRRWLRRPAVGELVRGFLEKGGGRGDGAYLANAETERE